MAFPAETSNGPGPTVRTQLAELFDALRRRSAPFRRPVALAAVFVVAYLAIAGLYFQSGRTLGSLESRITTANTALLVPPPDMSALDSQLRAWETALAVADRARVRERLDSDFVGAIIDTTLDTGVALVSASALRDLVDTIDEREYGGTPYLVRVAGGLEDIQAFMRALEGGRFEALEIRSAVTSRDFDDFVLSLDLVVRNEFPSGPTDTALAFGGSVGIPPGAGTGAGGATR